MMPADPNVRLNSVTLRKVGAALGWIACWAWAIFVVSGGIGLLIIRGPWRPTHGWFALLSGLAACPLTATLLKKYAGIKVSRWAQVAAAVLFIVAGRIALKVGL
jgi:TctA family transporter